jgi:hypothetical protein
VSLELETWAVKMAARNKRPQDWITPVLLYRNGKPALMGASAHLGGRERIFTAAHGFSVDYPPCVWSFRKLIPSGDPLRPIAEALPLRGRDDDVALCTPASVLEMAGRPLPNFYTGFRRGVELPTDWRIISNLQTTVRSVLTGEDVVHLGEVFVEGRVHVLLDYAAQEGQSGTVFTREEDSCLYILRSYSKRFVEYIREGYPDIAHSVRRGTAFALRLRYE